MTDFYLDRQTAARLAAACDDLLAVYEPLLGKAAELATTKGFGTLPSGLALQKKFQDKAAGGEDSLAKVLASHIEVVHAFRAQFQESVDRAIGQESANMEAFRHAGMPE